MELEEKKSVLAAIDLLRDSIVNANEISHFGFKIGFDQTSCTYTHIDSDFKGWREAKLIIKWKE